MKNLKHNCIIYLQGAGLNSSIEEDSQAKQNVNNDNNDFDETFVEEEPFPSSSAYDQYTDNLSQV